MADTIQNTPRSGTLGAAADALGWLREQANQVQLPAGTLLGELQRLVGAKLGDTTLGQAPEEVDRWAYGNAPMRMPPAGTGGYLPDFKRTLALDPAGNVIPGNTAESRASPVLDALTLGQAGLPLTKVADRAGATQASRIIDVLSQSKAAPAYAEGGSVQIVPKYSKKAQLLARLKVSRHGA